MNENIRFYMSKANFSPVDYVWMDITEHEFSDEQWQRTLKTVGSLNTLMVKDHPLPFERMALVVKSPLNIKGNEAEYAAALVTIERKDAVIYYTLQVYIGNSKVPAVQASFNDMLYIAAGSGTSRIQKRTEVMLTKDFILQLKKSGLDYQEARQVFGEHFVMVLRHLYVLTVKPAPEVVAVQPYGDTVRNDKRRRKGKTQMWEWKTIEITPLAKRTAESRGGTHASPKPHERIGHWRQYKSGKRVFVKALIVNKHKISDEGFVFHDYVYKEERKQGGKQATRTEAGAVSGR